MAAIDLQAAALRRRQGLTRTSAKRYLEKTAQRRIPKVKQRTN
jgi:hypothetical protein